MGQPLFLLRIVDVNDPETVVTLPAGGSLERELITVCTEAVVKRGVGLFRTEARVKQAIADGLTEAIRTLKRQTKYAIK